MTSFQTNSNLNTAMLAIVASAISLSFLSVPVKAASEPVSFAKVSLASHSGRSAVDHRLEAAAERVCAAGGLDRHSRVEMKDYQACVTGTLAKARADLAAVRTETQMASR